MKITAPLVATMVSTFTALATVANGQALSPMRQVVNSTMDSFALRVTPKNPYKHRIRMEVKVYDHNFKLTPAHVSPKSFMMGAGGSRRVTVLVPFNGERQRRIRICAESIPYTNQPTLIRAQVCGRFLANRVN